MRVQVVGAGVIGLSVAVRLSEAGFEVEVLAREFPAETTSATAGAVWLPYRAEPADRVAAWGRATLAELLRLAADVPEAGVDARAGVLLHRDEPAFPTWVGALDGLSALRRVRDPAPGYPHGFAYTAPMIDVGVYLTYLQTRLARAGGLLTRSSLDALPSEGVVVNATGVAATALLDDRALYPVRGQTVVLDNPGLTQWLVDEHEVNGELTYVLPRRDDVVVGGSATVGDRRLEPDPALAQRMLERACRVAPALREARVRGHRVGLRPARTTVRLEAERGTDGTVIHCYGHGGAGYTLAWGCADDVLAKVRRTMRLDA